jgi:hypothetical protein
VAWLRYIEAALRHAAGSDIARKRGYCGWAKGIEKVIGTWTWSWAEVTDGKEYTTGRMFMDVLYEAELCGENRVCASGSNSWSWLQMGSQEVAERVHGALVKADGVDVFRTLPYAPGGQGDDGWHDKVGLGVIARTIYDCGGHNTKCSRDVVQRLADKKRGLVRQRVDGNTRYRDCKGK